MVKRHYPQPEVAIEQSVDYVRFARTNWRNREVRLMSTKPAVQLTETWIVAHVPVDKFEIVNGASAGKCMEVQETLAAVRGYPRFADGQVTVDLVFTLKTPASEATFRRTLHMADIFNVKNDAFSFTAIFSGCVVSGVYDMKTKTGWFNRD